MECTLDGAGRLLDVGTSWAGLGYSDGQPAGQLWFELIHEEERASCQQLLDELETSANARKSVLARTQTASGSFAWMRWLLSKTGTEQIHCYVMDVRAEHEMFEQYRLGIEASPTGLLMVDEDGILCLVNRQIEQMFGHERGSLLGQKVEMLIPGRFRSGHPAMRKRFQGAPESRAMGHGRELYGIRKDGTEFAIEIGLNPLATETGSRVLASIVDVTERKRQEAELRNRVTELQRYQKEMDLLSEMSSLLQHALHENEAHEIVAGFGKQLLPSIDVSIYALKSSRDALELKSHWGDRDLPDRFGAQECWALRRTQVHRAYPDHDNTHSSPHCLHGSDVLDAWQTCVPMSAHGQSSGVVSLSYATEMPELERKNLERVGKAIADQLALALSNIQLREGLRALAIRDPLTGLYNRRYLEESVERELNRAQRRKSAVSVLMVDIDHFRRFNETHGHQGADEALARFGAMLKESIRKEDIACRFGGEEFVLLLPDCHHEDGIVRADELCRKVADSPIGFTLSIGVAEWPLHGLTWNTVLRTADQALYQAKANGRNTVHSPTGSVPAHAPAKGTDVPS